MKLIFISSSDKAYKFTGDNNLIFRLELDLHDTYMTHEKSMFNIFDLLADVGGLLDLFLIICAIALKPFNSYLL